MISFDLNHLNVFEFGLILIILGVFSIWFGNSVYRDFKKENYNPFKITKRENQNDYNNDSPLSEVFYLRQMRCAKSPDFEL